MIQGTMHVLAVPNLEASAEFYRDVLGFEVHEMGDPGWRRFSRGACQIMVGDCPDAIHPNEIGDHSYFGYFIVDDIDHYYERVVLNGAEVTKSLRDEKWGMREFGLKTIDGHRMMIGQERAP